MQTSQPQTLRQTIRQKPIFFLGILIVWAFVAALLLFFSKKEIHLFLNKHHTNFGDAVFPWLSRLGEEFVYIFMGLVFIFKRKYRALLTMFIAILVHTGIIQILKNFVFTMQPRPKAFFGEEALNFVAGIEVHSYMSFPSGHTATAFSVFCLVVLFHKHWGWQLMALLGACSVAMARMYLQQHFLVDTFFGSIIGTFSALVAYAWYLKQDSKLQK
ncbi:MAG: phosphatase PAP2 family protein [Raineya sp.]